MSQRVYVWLLNSEVLEEMYRRLEYKEAITENERTETLMQMHKEGLVECLGSTELSKEELKSELAKDFNILEPRKNDETA